MTNNDLVLADQVSTIIQHARKLNELLRDGKVRELEIVLGTINEASTRGIYRCMDIIYERNPAKAIYGGSEGPVSGEGPRDAARNLGSQPPDLRGAAR